MNEIKKLRKRFFVDPTIQGSLVVRVVMYWMFCLMTIVMMLFCWRVVSGPIAPFWTHFADIWQFYGPALIASFLLLPLVAVDIVKMSNRFVGPLMRLRRSMRALARGEEIEPLEFRDNDYWQEFAGEFNEVLKLVQKQKRATSMESAGRDSQAGRDSEEELLTSAAP
jgi:hypothetical protein